MFDIATDLSDCNKTRAYFFIQYTCIQDKLEYKAKYDLLASLSCTGVFICLTFIITIYYLKKKGKFEYLKWDIKTITAGDYSVEYKITPKSYKYFMEELYPQYK